MSTITATELFDTLERQGLRLALDAGGALRCYGDLAKAEKMLPTIRQHKPELLAALTGKPASPLGDEALARLVREVAASNRLDPLALWNWLDPSDIEGLRSGDPAEARAFRYMVSLPTWDGTPPPVPHGLPFPGAPLPNPTDTRPIHHPHSHQSDFEDTDMALLLTESDNTFEQVPAGTFLSRCYRLIDLGTQKSEWQGEARASKKILLQFEILDPETRMSDGRPFVASKRYTASLNEKAALRKDLESWRGRAFSPEELRGFDVSKLLGQPCFLSIVHQEKGGREYANISALMKLPKGIPAPDGINEPLLWDFDKPDWDVYEKLGQRLQAVLEATPEWARIPFPVATPPAAPIYPFPSAAPAKPAQAAPEADFDDDVPF